MIFIFGVSSFENHKIYLSQGISMEPLCIIEAMGLMVLEKIFKSFPHYKFVESNGLGAWPI